MTSACLGQEKAGAADAGFVMVARLAESAARSGDRSYRDLLLESGAIGQRIYLAAEAVGLVARNLAAYMDDRFNRLLSVLERRLARMSRPEHRSIVAQVCSDTIQETSASRRAYAGWACRIA